MGAILDNVLKLNPVTFKWKDPTLNQDINYGLIADEVLPLFADLVKTKSFNHGDGTTESHSALDKEAFTFLLIRAVQEMAARLKAAGIAGF
jgi:hypothetical protein